MATFLDHLAELRSKLLLLLGATAAGAVAAHAYHEERSRRFVLRPAGERQFVFLSPLDPLTFILKLDILVWVVVAFPVIAWCLTAYVMPAVSVRGRPILYAAYACSALLLAAGLSYAYVVTLPLSLRFLSSVTVPGIVSTLTAQSYLNFVLAQLFVCMLVFQVPIVLVRHGDELERFHGQTSLA